MTYVMFVFCPELQFHVWKVNTDGVDGVQSPIVGIL